MVDGGRCYFYSAHDILRNWGFDRPLTSDRSVYSGGALFTREGGNLVCVTLPTYLQEKNPPNPLRPVAKSDQAKLHIFVFKKSPLWQNTLLRTDSDLKTNKKTNIVQVDI